MLDVNVKWYGRAFIQFNINRFVYTRSCAFRYKKEGTDEEVMLRDAKIYDMDDVQFVTLDFFKDKKFTFYCTTERYDWRLLGDRPGPPARFQEQKKWRENVFKPAQENTPGFITGKDVVFELDCAGHKKAADWETGIEVSRLLVDALKDFGLNTIWVVFSGSGGFHIWAPWEEIGKYYKERMALAPLAEFTKGFMADISIAAGAKIGENQILFIKGIGVDITPTTKRGLIRCPYSLHPKTDNVVYPFTKREFEGLTPDDVATKFSVRYVLGNVQLKNRGMPNVR